MNTIRMPGFTAEASFSKGGAHHRVGAMLAGLRQGGELLVHPALVFYCGEKYCCMGRIPGAPGLGFCCPISGPGPCIVVYTDWTTGPS
jgi:hypothetical protein